MVLLLASVVEVPLVLLPPCCSAVGLSSGPPPSRDSEWLVPAVLEELFGAIVPEAPEEAKLWDFFRAAVVWCCCCFG